MDDKNYGRLGLMSLLHFGAMYALMYAMADRLSNVIPNTNQLYMAGLMTAPMLLFELLLMRSMYPRKAYNWAILGFAVVLLGGSFLMIRQQTAIGDVQFLRSMIPHHAGAILMCEEASLQDAEIRSLCRSIVSGQQAEIDLMKAKLAEIEGA